MELRMTEENAHIKASPHSQLQGNLVATGVRFWKNNHVLDLIVHWPVSMCKRICIGSCLHMDTGLVRNKSRTWFFFSKSTPSRNQVYLTLPVRLRFYVSILSCLPHLHGAIILFFLEISCPVFFFAEKVTFTNCRGGGRIHLTAFASCPGKSFDTKVCLLRCRDN